MRKPSIYKQLLAFFIPGIVIFTTLGGWRSVQAETESPISPNTEQLNLVGDGKPFKPTDLEQSEKPYEGDRGIPRGIDNRMPVLSRYYPWSAIGRVQGTTADAKSYYCTGTLIADDIVLTNAHCVIDTETHQLSKELRFIPNVINGKLQSQEDIAKVQNVTKNVWYGTDFKNGGFDNVKNQSKDWALIRINQPLARKYGRLGWKSVPSSTLIKQKQDKLFFVGYSGDYPDPTKEGYESYTAGKGWTAGYEDNCSIVGEESNLLLHDCATAGGASGGPIIDWIDGMPYIVALNNGEVTIPSTGQDIINFAVKMDFLDKLTSRK
ncbi:trypsin-like peptidase domain-containing protein [Nostoc sp. NMS9]|uniref:trypsin-like serine peptidase n=1 Tax=Nostoc sp. NMS9 TaxID=2815393 RepID=UPI0025CC0B8B|nr:trypsin-like peptidase domain-containing protein [Nostoc sp. NMS9]MBN3938875.1 trypsin-like peptidase domain-containing protein [Nostoc sp. NMS9]